MAARTRWGYSCSGQKVFEDFLPAMFMEELQGLGLKTASTVKTHAGKREVLRAIAPAAPHFGDYYDRELEN